MVRKCDVFIVVVFTGEQATFTYVAFVKEILADVTVSRQKLEELFLVGSGIAADEHGAFSLGQSLRLDGVQRATTSCVWEGKSKKTVKFNVDLLNLSMIL